MVKRLSFDIVRVYSLPVLLFQPLYCHTGTYRRPCDVATDTHPILGLPVFATVTVVLSTSDRPGHLASSAAPLWRVLVRRGIARTALKKSLRFKHAPFPK
jgi:hypothetical protein